MSRQSHVVVWEGSRRADKQEDIVPTVLDMAKTRVKVDHKDYSLQLGSYCDRDNTVEPRMGPVNSSWDGSLGEEGAEGQGLRKPLRVRERQKDLDVMVVEGSLVTNLLIVRHL